MHPLMIRSEKCVRGEEQLELSLKYIFSLIFNCALTLLASLSRRTAVRHPCSQWAVRLSLKTEHSAPSPVTQSELHHLITVALDPMASTPEHSVKVCKLTTPQVLSTFFHSGISCHLKLSSFLSLDCI